MTRSQGGASFKAPRQQRDRGAALRGLSQRG
jgi:hypothetical protein